VRGEAVEFDREARARPYEVELVALDGDGGLRWLDAVSLEDCQKAVLELRARAVPRAADRCHQLRASAARVVLNDGVDGGQIELVRVLRLRDHPFQCLWCEHVGEVEQGPRQRGHGDSVPHRNVLWPQPSGSVEADPCLLPTPIQGRHRHLDVRRVALTKLPQLRGIAIRKHRSRPARKHRRQPAPFQPEPIVADGVHAAVETM